MQLSDYEDVQPNWEQLQELNPTQADAVLTLLLSVVMADNEISDDEAKLVIAEIDKLPTGDDPASQTFFKKLKGLREQLSSVWQKPAAFLEFLESQVESIPDERPGVLWLVAINATAGETHVRKQELTYVIGDLMEVPEDTVEHVLRSAWESKQNTEHGEDAKPDVIISARDLQDRKFRSAQMPLKQPTQTDMTKR